MKNLLPIALIGGAAFFFLGKNKASTPPASKKPKPDIERPANRLLPKEAVAPINFEFCEATTGDLAYAKKSSNAMARNLFDSVQMLNSKGEVVAESSSINDYSAMEIEAFDVMAVFYGNFFRVEVNTENEDGCAAIPPFVKFRLNFKDGHSDIVQVNFTRGL